jgi:hypothetical protein
MSSSDKKMPDPADNYFDTNTTLITLGFLATYFIIYAFINLFFDEDAHQTKASFVDVVFLVVLSGIGVLYYYSLSAKEQDTFWSDMTESTRKYLNNSYSILEVAGFIVLLKIGIALFGIPVGPEMKPWSIGFLESIAYLFLTVLIPIQVFKYIFQIDIVAVIFGEESLFKMKTKPKTIKKVSEDDEPTTKEEVFNVSNNLYTYDDAKAVCRSMGSRLATYDEIEASYMGGAEWTSYGWSEGQHAYFPTQKATWARLQEIKGHEHDLGRPGVNGGYFANPNVRLGVNCYGVRPQMSAADTALMNAKKNNLVPRSKEEIELDKKVQFWKENKDKFLVLSGFNNEKWSKY